MSASVSKKNFQMCKINNCKNAKCLATNVNTGEEVAIKLEQGAAKHPQLHIECKFYKIMQGGGKVLDSLKLIHTPQPQTLTPTLA